MTSSVRSVRPGTSIAPGPEAKLVIVPNAGHSMTEPGIRSALIEETERFARL